jgi:hypothetical protein
VQGGLAGGPVGQQVGGEEAVHRQGGRRAEEHVAGQPRLGPRRLPCARRRTGSPPRRSPAGAGRCRTGGWAARRSSRRRPGAGAARRAAGGAGRTGRSGCSSPGVTVGSLKVPRRRSATKMRASARPFRVGVKARGGRAVRPGPCLDRVVVLAVELDQFRLEIGAHRRHDLLHPGQVPVTEHFVPELGHEDQVGVQGRNAVPAGTDAFQLSGTLRLCSSVTATGCTRTPSSVRHWPERSGARGWCSTTGCAHGSGRGPMARGTSRTANCPSRSLRGPRPHLSGSGWVRCRRWCSSRLWRT